MIRHPGNGAGQSNWIPGGDEKSIVTIKNHHPVGGNLSLPHRAILKDARLFAPTATRGGLSSALKVKWKN
jgi:nitrogen fixation protein